MCRIFCFFAWIYTGFFNFLQKITEGWLPGLFLRLVFLQTLFFFFFDSAKTKFGAGLPDIFIPQAGAYAQILPKVMESLNYDQNQLSWPCHLVVYVGSYAEFLLPILIVLGLFTRLASLGMMIFVGIMTYVDIIGHHVGQRVIGTWFNSNPSELILDQRALWLALLLVLTLRGGGVFSLDWLFSKMCCRKTSSPALDEE